MPVGHSVTKMKEVSDSVNLFTIIAYLIKDLCPLQTDNEKASITVIEDELVLRNGRFRGVLPVLWNSLSMVSL